MNTQPVLSLDSFTPKERQEHTLILWRENTETLPSLSDFMYHLNKKVVTPDSIQSCSIEMTQKNYSVKIKSCIETDKEVLTRLAERYNTKAIFEYLDSLIIHDISTVTEGRVASLIGHIAISVLEQAFPLRVFKSKSRHIDIARLRKNKSDASITIDLHNSSVGTLLAALETTFSGVSVHDLVIRNVDTSKPAVANLYIKSKVPVEESYDELVQELIMESCKEDILYSNAFLLTDLNVDTNSVHTDYPHYFEVVRRMLRAFYKQEFTFTV